MKTLNFISERVYFLFSLVIVMSLTSCYSTQTASGENDGVYYDPKKDTKETVQVLDENLQPKKQVGKPYFDENGNAPTYAKEEVDTIVVYDDEPIVTNQKKIIINTDDYTDFGNNAGVDVNINYYGVYPYNSWNWYYNNWYGPSYAWGWNSWHHHNYWSNWYYPHFYFNVGFGGYWNNWYYPNMWNSYYYVYGYPYYGNYYGYGYGYGYYGNYYPRFYDGYGRRYGNQTSFGRNAMNSGRLSSSRNHTNVTNSLSQNTPRPSRDNIENPRNVQPRSTQPRNTGNVGEAENSVPRNTPRNSPRNVEPTEQSASGVRNNTSATPTRSDIAEEQSASGVRNNNTNSSTNNTPRPPRRTVIVRQDRNGNRTIVNENATQQQPRTSSNQNTPRPTRTETNTPRPVRTEESSTPRTRDYSTPRTNNSQPRSNDSYTPSRNSGGFDGGGRSSSSSSSSSSGSSRRR